MPDLFAHDDVLTMFDALPTRPWEIGGWLIGYWTTDRAAVVVTHATRPAVRGTPFGIEISAKGHRRRFDEIYDQTGGRATFLGDWHTHPGGGASPSGTDRTALKQLATDPDYDTPEPVIAIVSTGRLIRTPHQTRWWQRDAEGAVGELTATGYGGSPLA